MRYTPALAVAMLALLIAAGVSAYVLGGRMFDGVAPAGSPSAPPASGAGSATVELSADAGRHASADAVRSQLQHYFDAVNARDYELWSASVVPERVAQQTREQWTASVDTVTDGTIRVDRIDDLAPGRFLVLVRFVSTQSLDDAPVDLRVPRICWRGAFPMTGAPPRLETGSAGSLLSEPC